MSRPQPARRRLLATLRSTGPIADRSGRATSLLADAMGYESRPVSLSPLLSGLEADGLVRREVRGRRCFMIELTNKGQALIALDEGLDHRQIGAAQHSRDADVAPDRSPEEPGWTPRAAPVETEINDFPGMLELLRRQLHDALLELGALKQRVSDLERMLWSSRGATTVVSSEDDPVRAIHAGSRSIRTGKSARR